MGAVYKLLGGRMLLGMLLFCGMSERHVAFAQSSSTAQKTATRYVVVAPEVAEANLIHKVEPHFKLPDMAARVMGTVVLRVFIDKQGHVARVRLLSGPPMLNAQVIRAVKQWQYKPFLMDGRAVLVETRVAVTVNTMIQN